MTTPNDPNSYYVEPRYQIHTPSIAEFQEQCSDFIAKIAAADDDQTIEVIIFDGDDPVAILTRYHELPPLPKFPHIKVEILGDIVSPMPSEWFKTWKELEEEKQ